MTMKIDISIGGIALTELEAVVVHGALNQLITRLKRAEVVDMMIGGEESANEWRRGAESVLTKLRAVTTLT